MYYHISIFLLVDNQCMFDIFCLAHGNRRGTGTLIYMLFILSVVVFAKTYVYTFYPSERHFIDSERMTEMFYLTKAIDSQCNQTDIPHVYDGYFRKLPVMIRNVLRLRFFNI